MKPIKLKFYGLNSFIKPQEIDFTKLSTGVFGIFGKTGSGKTTILDAIMLALYGQISKSTKAVDFINSKCDECQVELIFKTGASENKTYFVERKYRRRKDTTVPFAWFGEIVNENKLTLAEGTRDVDSKIKENVGLSFNEFSKCIALPQGEFAGFLNATAAERTEIISNIFSLQDYGDKLVEKVRAKQIEMDTKRQVLEAQKSMLRQVSKADIEVCEAEIKSKQRALEEMQKVLSKKNDKLQEQKRIFNLYKRRQECVLSLEDLYKQKNVFRDKEILCEKQKRALIIQGEIKRVSELTESTSRLKELVLSLSTRKVDAQNKYNAFVSENEDFNKHYQENLISLTKQETALTGAVEDEMILLSLGAESESLTEKLQNLNKEYEEAKSQREKDGNQLIQTKNKIEKVEEQLNKIEGNDVDFSLKEIKEIEAEIIIYQTLEKQVERLIDNAKQDIEDAQLEYSKLVKAEKEAKESLLKEGLSIESVTDGNLAEEFSKLSKVQEKVVEAAEIDRRLEFVDILMKQKEQVILSKQRRVDFLRGEYWRANKDNSDGKLAELKGEINFVNNAIEEEKEELKKLEIFKDKLYLKIVDNNNQREINFAKYKKDLQDERERLEKIFAHQNENRRYLLSIQMKKVEFGTRISVAKENSEILLDLLFGLQKFRAEHEFTIYNARERLAEENIVDEGKGLNDIKHQKELELRELLKEQTLNAEIQARSEMLVQSLENDIAVVKSKLENIQIQIKSKQEIYNQAVKGQSSASVALKETKQEIKDITERFEYNKEKTEKLKQEAEKLVQEYTINSKILDEQARELSDISFVLKGRIFDLGFKDSEEVLSLITSETEIFKCEEEIKNYKQKLGILEKELENLNGELGGAYVDEKEFTILEKEIEELSEKIHEEQLNIGSLIASLESSKEDFEKLTRIENELPAVVKILDDAKELSSLLRGKALVEFIAEEYMVEITRNANDKLNMLMGGRYELEFNENNFVVYDNFNDHLPRPVQTLSGGETFLVSLSLALAISETISFSSNKSMEFFFLDEGFGTLDSELIESVISALYKLESQNLKIGLISHVKELEEEIKNKILVDKATETEGSTLKIVHLL